MLKTIASAAPASSTPIARLKFWLCDRIRRATRCPPSAISSIGTAAPTAYASVSSTVSTPIRCCAESAVIVASTGPAHGTKTRPRLTPSRNPPPRSPPRRRVMKASGRSSRYAIRGKSSDAASTKSSAIAMLRSTSCGSPSAERIDAAASVKRVKLATRPAMIANGRRPEPLAPPASTIGSTGRMHGDTAVITPARKPIPSRTTIDQAYSGVLTRRLNSAPQRGRSEA